MAEIIPPEPQSANDYDDRTNAAVKSVLVEIGQILGSFEIIWKSIKGKDSVMPPPVHRFRPLIDASDPEDGDRGDKD